MSTVFINKNELRKIEDNHPKFVLSMDRVNFSQDGIIHQNILDFFG
jgi:hypothetical protein